MNLRFAQEPVVARRLGGLALSVPLHVATLMMAVYDIVTPHKITTDSQPDVQITHVTLAPKPAAPREPMLLDQGDLFTDLPDDSASLSLPDFEFNITKISTRRTVLFTLSVHYCPRAFPRCPEARNSVVATAARQPVSIGRRFRD